MLHKKILLYSFIFAVAFSCTPDRGTYNHIELNEVRILGINDEDEPYEVNRFSEFTIPVELEFSKEDDNANFEYLWYMYSIGEDKIDTICREKDLKYKFNELPKEYSVVYKVIDKKHDVYYHKNCKIKVINTINEGFMILGVVDDSVHISMVNKSGILSSGLYHGMKGKYIESNPEGIFHFVPGNKGTFTGREYITVTHNGGKALLFDPINFVNVGNETDMFVLPPTTYNIMGYNAGGLRDFLINDYKIHSRVYYITYNAAMRGDAKDYKASTISLSKRLFNCFYDTMNRRFITTNSSETEIVQMALTRKSKPFEIANVQMDLIAASTTDSGFASALMRDDKGNMVVLEYILRTEVDVTKMQFTKSTPVSATSPINSAKQIIFPVKQNTNFMLYIRENDQNIYLYDILGNVDQESGEVTRDHKILTIDSNLKIEKIFAAENQFAITYTDTTANGERKCGIMIFDVDSNSDIVKLVEKFRHDEITERIVDVAYKFNTI